MQMARSHGWGVFRPPDDQPCIPGGFSDRPITMIVPFPAGATDTWPGSLGERMRAILGQPVIIENVGGAAGIGRDCRCRGDRPSHGNFIPEGDRTRFQFVPYRGNGPAMPDLFASRSTPRSNRCRTSRRCSQPAASRHGCRPRPPFQPRMRDGAFSAAIARRFARIPESRDRALVADHQGVRHHGGVRRCFALPWGASGDTLNLTEQRSSPAIACPM